MIWWDMAKELVEFWWVSSEFLVRKAGNDLGDLTEFNTHTPAGRRTYLSPLRDAHITVRLVSWLK